MSNDWEKCQAVFKIRHKDRNTSIYISLTGHQNPRTEECRRRAPPHRPDTLPPMNCRSLPEAAEQKNGIPSLRFLFFICLPGRERFSSGLTLPLLRAFCHGQSGRTPGITPGVPGKTRRNSIMRGLPQNPCDVRSGQRQFSGFTAQPPPRLAPAASSAYSPPCLTSSACVPRSRMPCSPMTMISSAFLIVERRCAITSVVRPCARRSNAA